LTVGNQGIGQKVVDLHTRFEGFSSADLYRTVDPSQLIRQAVTPNTCRSR